MVEVYLRLYCRSVVQTVLYCIVDVYLRLYCDALGLDWQDSMVHWRPLTENEKQEIFGPFLEFDWIKRAVNSTGDY